MRKLKPKLHKNSHKNQQHYSMTVQPLLLQSEQTSRNPISKNKKPKKKSCQQWLVTFGLCLPEREEGSIQWWLRSRGRSEASEEAPLGSGSRAGSENEPRQPRFGSPATRSTAVVRLSTSVLVTRVLTQRSGCRFGIAVINKWWRSIGRWCNYATEAEGRGTQNKVWAAVHHVLGFWRMDGEWVFRTLLYSTVLERNSF